MDFPFLEYPLSMSIVHEWKLLVFANKIRTNRNTCLLNEAEITSKKQSTKKRSSTGAHGIEKTFSRLVVCSRRFAINFAILNKIIFRTILFSFQFAAWVDAVIFVFSLENEASFNAVYNFYTKMSHFRNSSEIPIILVGTQGERLYRTSFTRSVIAVCLRHAAMSAILLKPIECNLLSLFFILFWVSRCNKRT